MQHQRTESEDDLRDRPIGELLGRLGSEVGTLVRQEADLAKAEITEKVRTATPGVAILGVGGVVGLLAGGALTAFAVLALALAMPAWAAALIVAAMLGVLAYALVIQGRDRLRQALPPTPTQTIETVKEDIGWVRHPTRSGTTSNGRVDG